MTAADLVREALVGVLSHRRRSALSALGMATGVSAIIAAMAFASGAERRALTDLASLGIDNIVLRHAADPTRHEREAPVLSLSQTSSLAALAPGAVVAARRSVLDEVSVGARHLAATIAGVTAGWRLTSGLEISGRWFSSADDRSRVIVMSETLARALFHHDQPLGQSVFAAGEWRTIIGVFTTTAGTARHADLDRTLFVPAGTLDLAIGQGDDGHAVEEIVMQMPSAGDVSRTAASVRAWLARTFGDRAGQIEVIVPRELLQARRRAERGFHALLFAMGTLALAIGGIGITSMQLAVVVDRTTEIGVRRACGARRAAILGQFALESVLLGSVGGAIGVPAGIGIAIIVAAAAAWPVAIAPISIAMGLAMAVATSLAAAIYPARVAASVTPMQAITSERA